MLARSTLMLASATLLALGGCKQDEPPRKADPAGGVLIEDGRLVLPAVKGNPAAAYVKIANVTDKPIQITEVAVSSAMGAMMHETVGGQMKDLTNPVIPAKGTLDFSPGARHIMVMGLPPGIIANSTLELSIKFAGGGRASTPLVVQNPGQ